MQLGIECGIRDGHSCTSGTECRQMTGIAVQLELSVKNMTEIFCGQKFILFNCKLNCF